MNNFEINVMTIDDYDAVYALWHSIDGMGLNDADDSRAAIDRFLRRNPAGSFVARKDGIIVGAVLGGHDGRRGTIRHLAVPVSQRSQGIGKALIDAVLDNLRSEGIRKVWILVFEENVSGNTFWAHAGFTTRPDIVYRDLTILP